MTTPAQNDHKQTKALDAEALKRSAGQTIPVDAFDAEAMAASLAQVTSVQDSSDGSLASGGDDVPTLERLTLAECLPTLTEVAARGQRYVIGELLGKGGSGNVFSLYDRDFHRDVALKVIHGPKAHDPKRLSRFVTEAQVTAQLEHPGILPVYDVDVTAQGSVYFTMRKIDGLSLGECIHLAQAGNRPAAIAHVSDGVSIILRVAEALAFAHHRHIIHQDIKPDNIMIGAFGEVVLVDWGTAIDSSASAGNKPLAGTPLFMSPEQAMREKVDERSDIYCLGATLFNLLTLRPPTWDDDPQRFWEKKRAGIVDPLTDDERRMVPVPLLDITLKALQAKPCDRYESTQEMVRDLKAWQSGLVISAHRDTLWERLARVFRRHGPVIATATAAVLALAVVGGMWWREKLREATRWTIAVEDSFSEPNQDLGDQWQAWSIVDMYRQANQIPVSESLWSIRDSSLWANGAGGVVQGLSWKKDLIGDLRVEWTVTPRSGSSNINCYLGARNRLTGYVFHVGGYSMPTSLTLTKGKTAEILIRTTMPGPLVPMQSYRMLMEREGEVIRYSIDGNRILEFRDVDMPTGPEHQVFGFEVASTSYSIDDLSISTKPLPLRPSALSVADALYSERIFVSARIRYEEYQRLHPQGELVAEAAYRAARCLAGEDRLEEAVAAFESIEQKYPHHPIVNEAIARRAQLLLVLGNEELAYPLYARLVERGAGLISRQAAFLGYSDWLAHSSRLGSRNILDPDLPEDIAKLRLKALYVAETLHIEISESSLLSRCATLLNMMGLHGTVASDYVEQRSACAEALLKMGRNRELVEKFPDMENAVREALYEIGDLEELTRRFPNRLVGKEASLDAGNAEDFLNHSDPSLRARALMKLGRYEDVLRDYPEDRQACADALIRLNRLDEALARYGDIEWLNGRIRAKLGQWDAIIASGKYGIDVAYYGLAFAEIEKGDEQKGVEDLQKADAQAFNWTSGKDIYLARWILAPVVRWRLGLGGHPAADWSRWRVEHAYRMKDAPQFFYAVLLDGDVSSLPYDHEILELLRGIRAELAGDVELSRQCYQSFMDLPSYQRASIADAFLRMRWPE